jgi:hypothetical protein
VAGILVIKYRMAILYHYCSTRSFLSIVQNKKIWLSSLTLSNDSSEGRIVGKLICELAERDGIPQVKIDRLKSQFDFYNRVFDGLGFCLSTIPDQLSQWRGYADDGAGLCIGFDGDVIREFLTATTELPTKLHQVVYQESEQLREIEPAYHEIKSLIDDGALDDYPRATLLGHMTDEQIAEKTTVIKQQHMRLLLKLMALFPAFYSIKSAFQEENEWRIIRPQFVGQEMGAKFRPGKDRVIPYVEIDFPANAVNEIILGPKHLTAIEMIEGVMSEAGFANVDVKRSKASYR